MSLSPGSFEPLIYGRRRMFCCHGASLSGSHPPNSLPAVMECLEAAVPRLEVDVRFLSDDAMLVFHDAHFDARTTGTGRVDDATRSRAAALRYRAADAGICFLEEIVDVMAGSRTVLQVDLKLSRPITEFRARQLQSALLPLGDRVIVGSQAHWNLRALQDVPVAFDPTLQWCFSAAAPGLPRTLGVHGLWDDSPMAANARFEPEEYLEHRIRDLRGLLPNAVEWMVDIGTVLKIAELGVPLGERLRRNGCALAAWTLHAEDKDLAGTLKRLFKTGVETVITDAPGVAAKAAAALLL